MELLNLTLVEAAELIARGDVSPLELTKACLTRIESLEPKLNCFITRTPELALKQAQRIDARLRRGRRGSLLQGIPFTLKDLYETKGVRTTAGSIFFADHIPQEDATVVQKIRTKGAVFLGKTGMHEIALGLTNVNPHYGAVHNPWSLAHIPGGSSGGSAAALAAGMCFGSLGTDSGGSIRVPAALCGVVGLKPTYGRVSLRGVIPLSWTTDHAGPMARSVEDVAVMLYAIAGYDREDPVSEFQPRRDYRRWMKAGVKDWQIAIAWDEYFEKVDAQVQAAVWEAGRLFERLGARVERVSFPGAYEAARANRRVVETDAATFHQERLANQPELFGEDVRARLQSGASASACDYSQARRVQRIMRQQFTDFFNNYDLLLTPTTPVAAPPIEGPDALEQARLLTRFTAPFNLTGLPALSLPGGFTDQNLPIGLQLVCRPWAEHLILRAAWAYEQATEWHKRRPAL